MSEVLARGRARLTGILRRVGRAVYLEPDDPRIAADYGRVGDRRRAGRQGRRGRRRRDHALSRRRAARSSRGNVLKVLGDPDDPRTEIEKILACAVIPIEFPDEAGAQARATPQELVAGGPRRPHRPARSPVLHDRSRDRARLRRRAVHRGRPARRPARVGRGRRRLALRALGRRARPRGRDPRRVGVPAGSRDPDAAASSCRPDICSLNPMVDRCAMVVRLDYTADGDARRRRLRRRGDQQQGAPRLSGRRGGARGRLPRPARAVPRVARRARRGSNALARVLRAKPPGARRARSRDRRAQGRARRRRSAPRARRRQGQGRSGGQAGVPARRGVHDRRQRGGRQLLPQARRTDGVARPRAARPRTASRSSPSCSARTASSSTSTQRDDAARHEARARPDRGQAGRAGAVVPACCAR